jgi:predicted RNA-binding protein with PUA-like domain
VKSEPDVFSWDDQTKAAKKTTHWDGVRNYQARNFMRDGMKKGDLVFFYHSNAEPPGVAGICEVVKEAYPDPSQFDRKSEYFDEKATRENAPWVCVDVKAVEKFPHFVSLDELRATKGLDGMELLRKGSRLSVQPVSPAHWEIVCRLGRKG